MAVDGLAVDDGPEVEAPVAAADMRRPISASTSSRKASTSSTS